jgi:hypothetical protein
MRVPTMDKADDYLRDAAECLRLAARQASIEHRARLLQMAEAWIYLADRLRKKWPVRGPQIPSSTAAGRNKQISAAFLLQLEESLCAADFDGPQVTRRWNGYWRAFLTALWTRYRANTARGGRRIQIALRGSRMVAETSVGCPSSR